MPASIRHQTQRNAGVDHTSRSPTRRSRNPLQVCWEHTPGIRLSNVAPSHHAHSQRCKRLVLCGRGSILLHGILQNAQRSWLTAREETWLQASGSRQSERKPGRLHQIDKEASLSTLRTRRTIGAERRWSIFCSEPYSAWEIEC